MHEQFLLAALEQAKLGRGACAPNPSVGAVAVHEGAIIAQAFHKGAGTPHAEQLVLADLPLDCSGVSLYVTLEPCNHWGRTPPCVDAIIQHGIKQVFFAYSDPNPLVAKNNSSELLRAQGIAVQHLPLKIIDSFYDSYTHWVVTGTPRVTVKMAQTLDGKIGALEAERLILSNQLCAQFTHEQRAVSDIILTSARTVARDNPKMNVRLNGSELAKPVAIIDRDLSLNKDALIFSTAAHCHLYHQEGLEPPDDAQEGVRYHATPLKAGRIDLAAVIKHLGALGYHDVWVEAGGAVFSVLHQEGLVDRTYLYVVPTVLGDSAVSAYHGNKIFERKHSVSWHVMGDNVVVCMDWREDSCLLD